MRKNRIILWLLIVTGLALSWPIYHLFAELKQPPADARLAELDKWATEFYQYTRKGEVDAARERLEMLASQFPNQTLPTKLRIESLNAVTQSILAAKQVFSSPVVTEEKLLWHATQVRVALDALHHIEQPLWKEYYGSYANQMQNLLKSAVERDLDNFRAQYEENHRLFLVIRPGMLIQLPKKQMDMIDMAYERIGKEMRKEEVEWQSIRESLRELNSVMQESFLGEDKSTIAQRMVQRSSMSMIAMVTMVVTITLAYVAWIKYQATHKVV